MKLTNTLSPEQWLVLSPFLDDALAMTDDERSVWLCSLRAQDPQLAAQLEELFRDHHLLLEEGFLGRPLRRAAEELGSRR